MYVASCSGAIFALDRRDGRERWRRDVRPDARPTSFHRDALVAESLLVIGTDGGTPDNRRNHVWAVTLESGEVRWQTAFEDGIVSDIVRAGSRVFAVTRADSLVCLDLVTGRRLWSFAADANASESQSVYRSPTIAGERVFVGDTEGRVHALAVASGRLLWTRALDAAIGTGILATGDELVLADEHGTVHRLDQATGAVRADIVIEARFYGPPVAVGDSLVVFAGDRAITCVDLASARVRWSHTLAVNSSRPYPWRGSVLAGTVQGELVAFRNGGMPLWSREFTGMIRGIGQDEQTLYVGTQEGVVHAYPLSAVLRSRPR